MSADDSKSELGEASLDEHHEHLIAAFIDFILDTLPVAQLICDLRHLDGVHKATGKIQKLENDGDQHGAAQELLQAIKRSREPLKWKMFFGALREEGASDILDVLLEEKPEREDGKDEWHKEHSTLIDAFSKTIRETLNLRCVLGPLLREELIYPDDVERLERAIRVGPHSRAVGTFLLILHRRKPRSWYEPFMTILYDSGYAELAKLIDSHFCEKLEKKRAEAQKDSEEADTVGTGGEDVRHTDPQGGGEEDDQQARPQTSLSHAPPATQGALEDSPVLERQQNQPTAARERASPEGAAAACTCGSCARLMAEMAAMKSELIGELASLRSDVAEMKLMLLKVTGNSDGDQG
ncbi:hypothetical protein BaRGS_00009794 [Batillaria attramentaria]|uniref:Caspase recruitment domain-containing protein n=1 Tax=Batillaria attramentaria TaxID=370345 RepID=A0ABD0LHU7_9CAEN